MTLNPLSTTELAPPQAPSGWRVLPTESTSATGATSAAEVHAFRGPSGLTVSVHDFMSEGSAWRSVLATRSQMWPTRLEMEMVVREFLPEGASYEVRQVHGLEHLGVRFEHRHAGSQGTSEQSHERLVSLALLNEAANQRREQSMMRASMARARVTVPDGWKRRPSPLGPPVYTHGGLQVIVCERNENGRRVASVSVARADRAPTVDEGRAVVRAFLGESVTEPTVCSTDEGTSGPRKTLVFECAFPG